jgi:MFS family permease
LVEQLSAGGHPPAEAATSRPLVLAAAMMAIVLTATRGLDHRHRHADDCRPSRRLSTVQLAFVAFLLTQAVSIPIYGKLADLCGRKPVFFAGTSLFLAASLLYGFAWGMESLIFFRALQGIGAGAIQPIATTIA